MENIKYSLFDLFSYVIPGALFNLSFIILSYSNLPNQSIYALFQIITKDANIYIVIIFVLLSFIAGYITSTVSNFLWWAYKKVKRENINLKSNLSTSAKFSLVREFSKENFKYIELWNVLMKMASNLSMVIILICTMFFFRLDYFRWYYTLIGYTLSFIIFLQAVEYNRWARLDLDNTVYILNLEKNILK